MSSSATLRIALQLAFASVMPVLADIGNLSDASTSSGHHGHTQRAGERMTGNPFRRHKWYRIPVNQQEYDLTILLSAGKTKENLIKMRDVASAYWIDVKSKVQGNDTRSVEGILSDAASKVPPEMVVLIMYDLPNRDCNAHASHGEICCTKMEHGRCDYGVWSECAEGLAEYRSEYVDPFVQVLARYKGKVPVVVIVEPDSLPNLATNTAKPHCGNSATQNAYRKGVQYALQELTSKTDAILYLDAAHGGWLGWDQNLVAFLQLLKELDLPFDKMRGFATNAGNYQPLGYLCPSEGHVEVYRNVFCNDPIAKSHPCCDDACSLLDQGNSANNELNFGADLARAARGILGWDARIVIDTGRNGVPDVRESCRNWCNPKNSGAGAASTTDVADPSIFDAYFWLKTPGESDGCSEILPDGNACSRYDIMCGSGDSIGSAEGEPNAPEAGQWFDFQARELARNARLEVPGPPPTPKPVPTTTSPPTTTVKRGPAGSFCCFSGSNQHDKCGSCFPSAKVGAEGWCGQAQERCEHCGGWGVWCEGKLKEEDNATRRPNEAKSTTALPPKCASVREQCGGKGWEGAHCCEAGCKCVDFGNHWYSQCVPPADVLQGCDSNQTVFVKKYVANSRALNLLTPSACMSAIISIAACGVLVAISAGLLTVVRTHSLRQCSKYESDIIPLVSSSQ